MKTETHDYVMVTHFEEVDEDDFYLSDDWLKPESPPEVIRELREQAKEGQLYHAWIVSARDYLIYGQMDAEHLIIDTDNTEVLRCESDVINTKQQECTQIIDYDF